MVNIDFEKEMKDIVEAIKEAGFEPYEQLTGYVELGNLCYITRRNNARERIQQFSREQISQYLEEKVGGTLGKTV